MENVREGDRTFPHISLCQIFSLFYLLVVVLGSQRGQAGGGKRDYSVLWRKIQGMGSMGGKLKGREEGKRK